MNLWYTEVILSTEFSCEIMLIHSSQIHLQESVSSGNLFTIKIFQKQLQKISSLFNFTVFNCVSFFFF